MGGERGHLPLGKIIVKTRRGALRATERKNKPRRISENKRERKNRMVRERRKGISTVRGYAEVYAAPPFYFMLRFAQKITVALAIPFESAF